MTIASCVHDIAVEPDGSAWVRADLEQVAIEDDSWTVGLFVIDPKSRRRRPPVYGRRASSV